MKMVGGCSSTQFELGGCFWDEFELAERDGFIRGLKNRKFGKIISLLTPFGPLVPSKEWLWYACKSLSLHYLDEI
jgi:hypothetical protein